MICSISFDVLLIIFDSCQNQLCGSKTDIKLICTPGNKFTGTIPQSLCRSSMNEDFFANVPSSQNRDYCDSVACPAGKVSFEGVFPCEDCQDSYFNPYLGR